MNEHRKLCVGWFLKRLALYLSEKKTEHPEFLSEVLPQTITDIHEAADFLYSPDNYRLSSTSATKSESTLNIRKIQKALRPGPQTWAANLNI